MPSPSDDRITYLEARLAELERRAAPRRSWRLPRLSLARRLTVAVLALLLALPAGVVLASHRFSDVPTSHQFHNAIAAVADAGVTAGCGGTRYCPNGLVTRGQMAAFLSRLGALAPGSAPKVNADRVDGRHANGLSRVNRFADDTTRAVPATPQTVTPLVFDLVAPAAGFVTVNANVRLSFAAGAGVTARIALGGAAQTQFSHPHSLLSSAASEAWIPMTWVFPVSAGNLNIWVELTRGTTAMASFLNGTASAIYTPYGWNGGSSLSP